MLYNKDLDKVQASSHCITCSHFDKKTKICKGLGKVCFEYEPKTKTIFDPVTGLPIRFDTKK